MSVEITSALIRQIQSTLRRSAGIPSSYDPSLPPLPSLQDAVSSLDTDPSIANHPRCGKCRRGAGLLRGAHSTLCIFCGRDRRLDAVDHSVSFNSTLACKNLLESLQLDGSEVIDLETESNGSSKGQDKQRWDGLILSNILDLELKWPPKKEEAVNRSSNKTPASVQAVNLSGVDLDSFFSDSNNNTASGAPRVTSEESMPNKQIISTESYVSSGSENVAAFNVLQTQDIGVSSANDRGGDEFSHSFADWEGGFQPASSPVSHAESESIDRFLGSSTTGLASSVTDVAVAAEPKPVDLFKDSTIEFSSHATPISTFSKHAPMEHEISNKADSREPTEEWGHLSSGASWIEDDTWPNKADQLQTTSKTIDSELKGDAQRTTSSTGGTWGQGSMKASNTKSKDDAFDDSLDSWQDFTSSNAVPGVSLSSWIQSGNEITSNEHASSSSKTVDLRDMEFSNFLHSDSFAGALGEQGRPSEVNDVQLKASASTSSIDKIIDENSLEALQDFTRPNEASGDLLNLWAQAPTESGLNKQAAITKSADPQDMEFGSFLLLDSFSGALGGQKDQKDPSEDIVAKLESPVSTNNINKLDNTNQTVGNDDFLEALKGFTSSKEAPGVLANSWTSSSEASTKHAPGVKYVDLQDSEFGSFVHSDPFSGVDGLKSSTYADGIPLDALVSMSKDTKQSNDNDDSWDAWQDFTSSKEAPGVLPNLRTSGSEASTKHAPGVKSVDLQDSEFGNFVFSDSFSGVDGQKSSADVNDVQLDALASNPNVAFKNNIDMNDNDGLFGSWKDAANFGEVPKGLPNLSAQTSAEITSYEHTSGVKSVDVEDMEFGGFVQSDMFSDEDSNKANDVQLDAVVSTSSLKKFDNAKIMDDNNDPFGGFLQSDMFSGMRFQEDSNKANDIQLDAFVSTFSIKEFNNTKDMNDNNDPFEAWQNFISSNDAQGSSASQSTQPDTRAISYKHASGTKSLDLQDMGFGSFSCSDSLPGAWGGKRGSSEVNEMQNTSISYRMNGIDEKTSGDSIIPGAAGPHENKILASNHESTNSKIEMLLSKMPDLSFMLEDSLSIPKKTDISNLKS